MHEEIIEVINELKTFPLDYKQYERYGDLLCKDEHGSVTGWAG